MFDPLHKWFGIPPSEQPPNHYRLLGIPLFEDDQDVIDTAADKHLRYLHDLSNGPDARVAEELSNSVSAARLLLLNPEKKAAYDRSLRQSAAQPSSGWKQQAKPLSVTNNDLNAIQVTPSPAQFQVGVEKPLWYLRHFDGVIHGPFILQTIVEAAIAGRIAPDTEVQHVVVTGGHWTLASSIPRVAEFLPVVATPTSQPASPAQDFPSLSQVHASQPAISVPKIRTRRRRSNGGLGWLGALIRGVIPLLTLSVGATWIYRHPAAVEQIVTRFRSIGVSEGKQDVTRRTQTVDATPQNPGRKLLPNRPLLKPEYRESKPVEARQTDPSDQVEFFNGPGPSGSQMRPKFGLQPEESDAGERVSLKIKFDSTRWTVPMENSYFPDHTAYVEIIKCPVLVNLEPETGKLSRDTITHLSFDRMFGLQLKLQLAETGDKDQFSLVGEWLYKPFGDQDSAFSLSRMETRYQFMLKQYNASRGNLSALNSEKNRLSLYINSNGVKPLDSVKQAENKIRLINSQLPEIQSRLQVQQLSLSQYHDFMDQVKQIQDQIDIGIRFKKHENPEGVADQTNPFQETN